MPQDLNSLDKEGFVSVQDLSDFELASEAVIQLKEDLRRKRLELPADREVANVAEAHRWADLIKPSDSL